MGWFAPSQENTPQHWFLLFFVSFLGLGRFGVRGEFSRWVPPYSIKGLWEPGGSGLQSSLRSDLANTPQHWRRLFFKYFWGLGRSGLRGEFLRWSSPYSLNALWSPDGERFTNASGEHSTALVSGFFVEFWGRMAFIGNMEPMVRGEFLRWFPPYSSKQLLGPGTDRF